MIYIFATTTILLLLAVLWMAFYYRHADKRTQERYDKDNRKLKRLLDDLEHERTRQNHVIADYKKRYHLEQSATIAEPALQLQPDTTDGMIDAISEKQQLEHEKEKFRKKNRKLWEQSIAVHHEKERIEGLRQEIAERHKELTDSINYAQRIQEALLPSTQQLERLLPNHFVLYRPRNVVSGDFFWVKEHHGKIDIAVADCTGHGVPGAFMSLLGISYLNEIYSNANDPTPAQVLESLRTKVKSSLAQQGEGRVLQDGMDMVFCSWNAERRQLSFAGANNNILVQHGNEFTEYKGIRNPIAVYRREKEFVDTVIDIHPNDIVYMSSDGYFDQFGGPKNQKIKKKGVVEQLTGYAEKDYTLPQINQGLADFVVSWMGNAHQIDDILVMGIQF